MALIKKILAMIFGGSVAAGPGPMIITPPVALDEILSYECAKHVTDLIPEKRQKGPVFHRDGLVFTSIFAAGGEKILIVNAGSGTFSVPLHGMGVNRLRFRLPANVQGDMTTYYLGYLHGAGTNARFYEFSSGRAPAGKDDLDFTVVTPKRAINLLPHMEYAVFETIEHTLSMVTGKRIERHELGMLKPDVCDHIARKSPGLARTMRYNLDLISAIIKGPKVQSLAGGGRMPASAEFLRALK